MPTINKRFLLKLVLVLLAFCGVLVGAHAVQSQRIPAALKKQSERAADNGKIDIAIHYLRQYLEFHPDEVDSQVRLAGLLSQRTPSPRGYAELLFLYDKILRLDPDRHAIRREALTTALRLGRYSDAVTHGEALLQMYPTEFALWQHLGTAQAGLNNNVAARRSYESAVSQAPEELIGYQRLAQHVWKSLDDTPGARVVLDRMVTALPQEPDAYLIRARFLAFTAEDQSGNTISAALGSAIADLQRVLELDPEHAEATLQLAEIMQRKRNIPAAHTLYHDAVTLYPKNLKFVRGLSWLELIRGNVAASITVLEDGLKATPDGFDLMVPLADLLVNQGDTTRTTEILHRLEVRKAPPTQMKYLRLRIAMRENQWQQAATMIESLRGEIVGLPGLDMQLNHLLAVCFNKLGDPVSEEKAFQRITNADPKNVTARIGLGNLYLNLGKFDAAARELEAALQSPFATGTVVTQWVRLKTRLLRNGTPDEWRKLEAAIQTYASRFTRGSSEPLILLADVLTAQGRVGESVKLLQQEVTRRASDGHLWAALATAIANHNGTAAGIAAIDEAQACAGDCVDVRLARAALYAREPGRVRPIEPIGEHIESWPENEQLRLLSGLVEVYDSIGDRANVINTLRRLVVRQPSNVAMWLKLHERASPANRGVADEARSALAKLEGENGHSVLLCDARTATVQNAPAIAERVIAAFGTNPTRTDACLVLAKLKHMAGDSQTAAALIERAFLLEPTRYESAEALLTQTATTERLPALLTRLANDPRWAGEPFRRMVGHVLPTLPPPVAATILMQCRPHVEREPNGLSWVAQCAIQIKLSDAVALLDEATRHPNATADDWLRKALYISKEDAKAGSEALAAARTKLSIPAYYSLVAVYCDSAAGSTFVPEASNAVEKRSLTQARLSVKLSRSQSADGGKLLSAFLEEKDITPVDADWARRNLAMIHALSGTPEGRASAMSLLKGLSSNDTATPEELSATASVLTTLGRYLEGQDKRAVLNKAIASLEAAYKITKAPNHLFAMSQLHRATGDRLASRRCLQLLLNDQQAPSYPYYLRAALDELVEDGNFAAADNFAAKLMATHSGDFQALASIARFECKAGHPERGLAVAEDFARLAEAGAGDYVVRSARVAELLDELSRLPNVRGTAIGRRITDAAVERFAAIVATRPEAIVGIAGALAADNRTAEAIERVERHNRHMPTRIRASAGLAIVRAGTVTEKQSEIVRQWLDSSLTEEPESVPLILNRAEFLALRHDMSGAIADFEKALAKEPRNTIALNNLAWLLASDPKTAEKALDLVTRATREGGLSGELLDTRARVHITLRQYEAAERDLAEAIGHDPTGLRWFHVALLRTSQTPANSAEANNAFAEAKRRGITPKAIHPADLPMYKVLDK